MVVSVAVPFVFRLFQTRCACGVQCSEGRLYEVELELSLGCVLGEVRCVKNVGVEVVLLVSGWVVGSVGGSKLKCTCLLSCDSCG